MSTPPKSLADFLVRVRAEKIREVAERQEVVPRRAIEILAAERYAYGPKRRLARAICRRGVAIIAEIKPKSPSAGPIRPDTDPVDLARAFRAGGASAFSVLTDYPHFGGSLQNLVEVRGAVKRPILRKDFLVDTYQVLEAWHFGADAVLLIVAMLSDRELAELKRAADELGLDALVEVHSREELDRALAVEPKIVGVNNRNLRDMTVDLANFEKISEGIPQGVLRVCESGVATRADVERVGAAGADAVLVGEVLMRAPDPEAKVRELLGAASG